MPDRLMKHFLILLLLLVSISGYSQRPQKETVIGRLKLPEGLAAELTYRIYSIVDTTFYFTFKDMQREEQESFATIRFTRSADLTLLYNLLLQALNGKKKKPPVLHYVGTNEIGLARAGKAKARLVSGSSFIELSEAQIRTLFGIGPQ